MARGLDVRFVVSANDYGRTSFPATGVAPRLYLVQTEPVQNANDEEAPVSFERHVRATDYGIGVAWRWIMILAVIGGAFAQIGMNYARFGALEESISKLSLNVGAIANAQRDLDKQTDRNTIELQRIAKENESLRLQVTEVRADNRQLSEQLDTLRNMREAYVYDSAKAARNKLLQQATTPP